MEGVKDHENTIDLEQLESQPHNGKSISKIVVSLEVDSVLDIYDKKIPYVVTYSENDKSILGWLVNIEKDGPQKQDVYFELDKQYDIKDIKSFVLYKQILLFRFRYKYRDGVLYYYNDYRYDYCYKHDFRKYLFVLIQNMI